MKIITDTITLSELKKSAGKIFGNMVKAVVDLDREILAIDAELHSDLEALLLREGASQKSLWGINLYPELSGDEFIEFDSMINLRPSQGNRSRGVDNEEIRKKIKSLILKKVKHS